MERSIETKLSIHYRNAQLAKMKLELISVDPIWSKNPKLLVAIQNVSQLQKHIGEVLSDVMRNG